MDEIYVECGKGWKNLYEPLIDLCKLYGAKVLQVKEKFGGLRFYFHANGDCFHKLQAMVDAAEARSFHTCENCGIYKVLRHDDDGKPVFLVTTEGSWLKSLCPDCRTKDEADRKAWISKLKQRTE